MRVNDLVRRAAVGSASLAVLAATCAPSALATDSELLPLPSYGDMVVDHTHRHVFVTGGRAANSVVVLDFSGRVIKKINDQFGAHGLVLSEDRTTLYVAQSAGDAVSAINTTTLAETTRYPTGPRTCPTHLSRTGPLVWFGYGCDDTWNGRIGKLDVIATPPVTLDQQGVTRFQRAPLVRSAGAATGPVVAGQLGLSLSDTQVYSVSEGTLTPGAAGEAGSNLSDIALSPDGATAYTAAGSRNHVAAFATTDLAGRGSYATGPYPNAVATTSNGEYLAAGAYTTRRDAIKIFEIDETVPVDTIDLDGHVLANRGLAWSADNKRLFVVLQNASDTRPRFAAFTW